MKGKTYTNQDITVAVDENLITISRNGELMKADTYSNWNEADDKFEEVCKELDKYIKKKKA
jgi:predicted transcriptional regulator